MSPSGLAQVSLCMNGMVHSWERGEGGLCWHRWPLQEGGGGTEYNVTLSIAADHRSFTGLSPESSSVGRNFLCVWCHLGLSGKLRPLNFQADPFLPGKCPWTQSSRRRAMTQLQIFWSSTAGSKAQTKAWQPNYVQPQLRLWLYWCLFPCSFIGLTWFQLAYIVYIHIVLRLCLWLQHKNSLCSVLRYTQETCPRVLEVPCVQSTWLIL